MKHILFLGYSNLVRKRILPIINKTEFTEVSIAKHISQEWGNDDYFFNKYDNFDLAFNQCKPDIIYISTINSSHFELAEKALNNGINVIVDKPATLSFKETEKLVNLAKEKNLLICESTVYLYHPQFTILNSLVSERKFNINHISIHFSFPPLNQDNFRYKKDAGGGAIYDTGPYTASIGRYFFNETPQSVNINIHEKAEEVETSYSALLQYSNGKSVSAFCGFTTEYINRICLIGNNCLIDFDRVFTIPDDFENTIIIKSENKSEKIKIEKANTFIKFFNEVSKAIDNCEFEEFYKNMLFDSEVIQMLNNKK